MPLLLPRHFYDRVVLAAVRFAWQIVPPASSTTAGKTRRDETLIVEVKWAGELASDLEAQLLSYLKISGGKIGLLLNFNVRILTRGGSKRLAN